MWIAETRLVPESELTDADRAPLAPAHQLSERRDAVEAFALGDTTVDLTAFTDLEAQFIDVYATVRKFRQEFRPEHILGLNPDGLVVDTWESRGFGGTDVTTIWLTKQATPRRPLRHIVWTLTWHFTRDRQWILVGSHACAHEAASPASATAELRTC